MDHYNHNHEHVHSTNVDPEIVRRDRRRLISITALQLGMTVVSGLIGKATASPAFNSEMVHDMGDTVINGMRVGATYNNAEHTKWYARLRLFSYAAISGFGLYKAGVAVHDLFDVQPVAGFTDTTAIELGGAGVIAAGNMYSYRLSKKLESPTLTNSDSVRHNRMDRNVSLATAAAITLGAFTPYVSELTGITVGAYTAWHMRPTPHNLAHEH